MSQPALHGVRHHGCMADETLQEVAARLARRSAVLPLQFQVGQNLDLVAPGGTDEQTHRPGLVLYGPLTWSVISSLWTVGYPARRLELEEIRGAVRQVLGTSRRFAPGGEEIPSLQRALVLWRVLSALTQATEEVAALAAAVQAWHVAGYPRSIGCTIGESFLKWRTNRQGGIVGTLTPWTEASALFTLLAYPDIEELELSINHDNAARIGVLTRTSSELAATGFAALVEVTNRALQRTFARYKHRITATSPGSAPLWLPHQEAEAWAMTDQRFSSGFGLLDWAPGSAHPELVLWPADDDDLTGYTLLMDRAFELFGLLIASVARFADRRLPAVPLLLPPSSDLTEADTVAIEALEASDYRTIAMARRFG
jgi:hypothetical protein